MQQTIEVTVPKPEQAITWLDRARAAQITNQIQAREAGELLHGIADLRKLAEEHHRPIISSAHKTHKTACDALKRVDEPLAQAEGVIRQKLSAYALEETRKAEEERRRIEEEARRQQEEEAESAIAEAEAQGASAEEVAALVAQADSAPVMAVPVPAAPVRLAAGVSATERWACQVVDVRALCKGIADGLVSVEMVIPNQSALNKMAAAMKGTFNIPGSRRHARWA